MIAEAGAMNWMEDRIEFEAKMGDGSQAEEGIMGKLWSAGQRALTGESRPRPRPRRLRRPVPGPHHPRRHGRRRRRADLPEGRLPLRRPRHGADIAFNRRLGTGFFGGEGFILQRLHGDGMAFVHAGGSVIERRLENETIRGDTGCLVAFTPGIDYAPTPTIA